LTKKLNFQNVFKMFIERKIQNEYEDYFKAVLKEAQQNQNQTNANMREVVGIKVGLEYMKHKEIEQERLIERKRSEDVRRQANVVYRLAIGLVSSTAFTRAMTIAIILNTLILSLDKYPIDLKTNQIVEKLNIAFTIIFILELIIRLTAVGIQNYYKE
jgi:Ion transport protein